MVNKSDFKSPLKNWENYASVRNSDRKIIALDEGNLLPFSPKLVPIVEHDIIKQSEDAVVYHLLGLRLFDYLRFTDYLETEAVVPAALLIAREEFEFKYTADMAFDGRKIATDEMYHAQCAEDLLQQMSYHTKIVTPPRMKPTFLLQLAEILENNQPADRPLIILFFSIVSETLVTSILKDLPNDESVMDVVRDVVRDHNIDEAKHGIFFSQVLKVAWEQLTVRQQDLVGPLVPKFMKMFLEPDQEILLRCLKTTGFSDQKADQVWSETYPANRILNDVKNAARPTIRKFEEVGAFENAATKEAFDLNGLL